jgi:pimeloyl-ACP methyl ester carboxylesterase
MSSVFDRSVLDRALLGGAASDGAPFDGAPLDTGAVDETRELPSGALHVRVWNSPAAHTVVLAHGLGGSVLDWSLLAPLLVPFARVIAFDMPGFGQSPVPTDGALGIAAEVRALAELIESLDGAVHLIGNSLGGVVAAQLAAFAPENVLSLSLLSPAFPDRSPRISAVPMLVFASAPFGTALFTRYQAMPLDKQLASKVSVSFGDHAKAPESWLRDAEASLLELKDAPHVAAAYAECAHDLLWAAADRGADRPWELARRITVPVLVTHSKYDQLVRPELRFKWGRVLPSSRRILFTNAGHIPQLSAPAVVAAAWLRFVVASDDVD